MRINIQLTTDNAAFDDNAGNEVARIIRDLAVRIEYDGLKEGDEVVLFDLNGNRVGEFQAN